MQSQWLSKESVTQVAARRAKYHSAEVTWQLQQQQQQLAFPWVDDIADYNIDYVKVKEKKKEKKVTFIIVNNNNNYNNG